MPNGYQPDRYSKHMNKKNLAKLVIATLLLLALAYSLRPRPVEVELATLQRGPLATFVEEKGLTRALDQYLLTAPAAGRVSRIEWHEGDVVAAGQALLRLTPLPLGPLEREQQQAELLAAQARQREAEAQLRRSEAEWQQWQRERTRQQDLARQGFSSAQQLEQVRNSETLAARASHAARYHVQATIAEVARIRAVLGSDKTQTLTLAAPAAGRILTINEKSERVVAAGTPLLTIGDPQRLEVVIDVLSSDAVNVRPGMPVWLYDWGGSRPLPARVRTVEPLAQTRLSALGVEEQRVNVIADLQETPTGLGHGYRVQARIVTWQNVVPKLPVSALFRCQQQWCVFAVDRQRRVRLQRIEIGQRNNDEFELRAGLAAGATVVRHPDNSLADGMKVSVRQPN